MPLLGLSPRVLRLFCLPVFLFLATRQMHAQASTTVVISQLYGAGGNSGATYNADYVELFNLGTTTVALDGWALQYGSATGSTISVVNAIPAGFSLKPGQYITFQGTPGTNGAALPTPADATISTIALAATAGKVYLTNTTTQLTGSCLVSGTGIVDFVGYGTTTTCAEGSPTGATDAAPAPSTTMADLRTNVCTDTQNNAADFSLIVPAPHNQSSTLAPCTVVVPTNPTLTNSAATPSTVTVGSATLITTKYTAGTNPTSTTPAVTADTSAFAGGTTTTALYDDGTHGDVTAGDGIYSLSFTVPSSTAISTFNIPLKVTDAQSRTGSSSVSITTQAVVVAGALGLSNAAATPSTVTAGMTTLLSVKVTPGTTPASTGIAVTANTAALGGTATQPLYDDGTHGDATAGDGIYSYLLSVPQSQAANSYTINFAASDSQARTASTSTSVAVTAYIPPSDTVSLAASTSTAVLGSSVSFTSVVTGNMSAIPGGSVTFKNNGNTLGNGTVTTPGTFVYTTTALPLGSNVITAAYSGDSTYPSNSVTTPSSVTTVITPVPVPDFNFTVANQGIIVSGSTPRGATTLNVGFVNGFSSTVSFTCSGLPASSRCTFSPASLSASGSSIMTVGVDGAALHPSRNNPFGSEKPLVALGLLAIPLLLRRKLRNKLGNIATVGLALLLGATLLTMTGCAGGNSTTTGNSTVTVTATGGGVTHTATLVLTVQ